MSSIVSKNPNAAFDYRLPDRRLATTLLFRGGAVALLLAVGSAAMSSDWSRLAHGYLLAITFCLSISLGALFFVVLQHLTNSRWSVSVRRVAELLMTPTPWLGVLFLPVIVAMLFGDSHLYKWNSAEVVAADPLIAHKSAYLNAPFFAVRCLLYFACWTGLSRFFLRNSMRQDAGDGSATLRMGKFAGPAMLIFALTVNFAAFDLLMSLEAHWFSTIFGVYYFGGCVVAFFAALAIALLYLQKSEVLNEEVTTEHFHDIGKLLFGFVFFWGYIAFSQYLLIWYAAIPEETGWYSVRQQNGWHVVGLLLLFGHFLLPFCGLMSRSARRSRTTILGWSAFLLVMHAVDLYWLVIPNVSPESPAPGFSELACLVGVGLIWTAFTLRAFGRHRLLSSGDPYLDESLAFHNV